MLMSVLTGLRYLGILCTFINDMLIVQTSELFVAETLKLPYQQDKNGWSWAELGLIGIHEFAARRLTPLQCTPIDHDVDVSPPPASDWGSPDTASSSYMPQATSPNTEQVAYTAQRKLGYPEVALGVPYSPRLPSEIIDDINSSPQWNVQHHINKIEAEYNTLLTHLRRRPIVPKPSHCSQSTIGSLHNGSPERWQQPTMIPSDPSVKWTQNLLSAPAPESDGSSIEDGSYYCANRTPLYELLFLFSLPVPCPV